jgi:hypothetical protein
MIVRHLVVRLSAIALFSFVVAIPAKAEILSIDCYYNGEVFYRMWVDTVKSNITVRDKDSQGGTYPAEITASTISWSHTVANGGYKFSWSIDRATGVYTKVTNYGGTEGPKQCKKGTTPLPANKF